jgi:hypothetical protein
MAQLPGPAKSSLLECTATDISAHRCDRVRSYMAVKFVHAGRTVLQRYPKCGRAIAFVLGSVFLAVGGVWLAVSFTSYGGVVAPWKDSPQEPEKTGSTRKLLATTVLRPTIPRHLHQITFRDRDELLRRLAPTEKFDLPGLLHALHLYGAGAQVVERGTHARARIIDLLLDSDRGTRHFGSRPLLPTRYGARFSAREGYLLGTNQSGTEAHPSQALAILAELGLPLNHPIRLPGDRIATLQVVLDDLIANFVLDGEIYWDILPLMLYTPPARSWRNKLGKEFTFEDVVHELLARSPKQATCAGTHLLMALAIMLRIDAETPVLSDPVRTEVREHLRVVVRTLTACQRPHGYWFPFWYEDLPGASPILDRVPMGRNGQILATGHHLEWLLLLPPELQPPHEVFTQSARWLAAALMEESRDTQWLLENYCPATHAARAALLLSGAEEAK